MWPLIRKQLYNAKVMRELQPELKRIKKESKGDRQKESMLIMDLYKQRGVSPFGSIGILLLQLPILIGLYAGLRRIIDDPNEIISFAYPFLRDLSWMKELATDISKFDATLFGFINLKRPALHEGGVYWPAMIIVIGSAVTQFYQSKQLMPNDGSNRKLRQILKDASQGVEADQAEVNAAVGQMTKYFIPIMIFFVTVNIASALSLYWLVSGLIAIIQQAKVLKDDEVVMETKLHQEDNPKKARSTDTDKSTKTTSSNHGSASKTNRKKVKSTARVVSITSEESTKSKTTNIQKSKKNSKKTKKRRK